MSYNPSYQQEVQGLRKTVESYQDSLDKARKQASEESQALKQDIDDLKRKLAEANAQADEAQKAADAGANKDRQLESLQQKVQNLGNQCARLDGEQKTLSKEIDDLNQKIRRMANMDPNMLQNLQDELDRQTRELDALRKNYPDPANLRQTNAELMNKIAILENDNAQKQKTIDELSRNKLDALKDAQNNMDNLARKLAQLQDDLGREKREGDKAKLLLKTQGEDYQQKLAELRAYNHGLEMEVNDLQNKNNQPYEQMDNLNQVTLLHSDNDRLKSIIKEKNNELDKMRDKMNMLEKTKNEEMNELQRHMEVQQQVWVERENRDVSMKYEHDIVNLKQEIRVLKDANAQYQERLSFLKNENELVSKALLKSAEQNQTMKRQIAQNQPTEMDQFAMKHQDELIHVLSLENNEMKDVIQNFRDNIQAMEEKHRNELLDAIENEQREKDEVYEKEIDDLRMEVGRLKNELTNEKLKQQRLISTIQGIDQENQNLKKQIGELTRDYDQLNQLADALQSENTNYKPLQDEVQRLVDEIKKLKLEKDQESNINKGLSKELNERKKDKQEKDKLEKALQASQKALDDARKQFDQEKEYFQNKIDELEQDIGILIKEQKTQPKEADLKQLQAENEALRNMLKDMQKDAQAIKDLQDQLAKLANENDRLRQEKNNLQKQIDNLKREIDRLEAGQGRNADLLNRLQDLQDRLKHLSQENERNQTLKTQFRLENENLQNKLNEAERQIMDADRKINNMPDPYTQRNDTYDNPVVYIEGGNHASIMDGPLSQKIAQLDLPSESPNSDVQNQIISAIRNYVGLRTGITDLLNFDQYQQLLTDSINFFSPLVSAFVDKQNSWWFTGADDEHGSSNWAGQAQIHMCSPLPPGGWSWKNASNGFHMLTDEDKIPPYYRDKHRPELIIDQKDKSISSQTVAQLRYRKVPIIEAFYGLNGNMIVQEEKINILNHFPDNGEDMVSALEISTKLASRQLLFNLTQNDSPDSLDDGSRCRDINQLALDWALNQTNSKTQQRYMSRGVQMVMKDDAKPQIPAGPFWIWKYLDYNKNKTTNHLEVTSYYAFFSTSANPYGAGNHYCQLLSPARAMEWIYIDSMR